MNRIEKEKLIKADIDSIENRVRHAFNQGYDLGYKEGKANRSEIPTGSTTKNDLGVDCIVDVLGSYTDLDIPYKREIAENILANLPSVTPQEPRWIPVSERLPKAECGESNSVLVCFENGTQDVLYFNGSNWCYPTGETYISVNHKNDWHNKVIAWMPLPKPYEPQESEG